MQSLNKSTMDRVPVNHNHTVREFLTFGFNFFKIREFQQIFFKIRKSALAVWGYVYVHHQWRFSQKTAK